MPSRGEDIREEDKITLMFGPGRQFQGVEVSVRDADILSLPSCSWRLVTTPLLYHPPTDYSPLYGPMATYPYAPPANPGLTPVQKAVFPSSQLRHRPSATLKGITTRSPFFSKVTPAPTSSTTPMFSWPFKQGVLVSKDSSPSSLFSVDLTTYQR